MIDILSPEGDAPFGEGLWWTIDVERIPKIVFEGHPTRLEANAYVCRDCVHRSCIPERVVIGILAVLSGALPYGGCEVSWTFDSPESDD